jgi:hypothetical protein
VQLIRVERRTDRETWPAHKLVSADNSAWTLYNTNNSRTNDLRELLGLHAHGADEFKERGISLTAPEPLVWGSVVGWNYILNIGRWQCWPHQNRLLNLQNRQNAYRSRLVLKQSGGDGHERWTGKQSEGGGCGLYECTYTYYPAVDRLRKITKRAI